jgi:diguanylate cyclase (GGDEF)-like protein
MHTKIEGRLNDLEAVSALSGTLIGIAAIALLALLDYLAGAKISLALLYLAPIILAAWVANYRVGLLFSLLAALAQLAVEALLGQISADPAASFWNGLVRGVSYLVAAYLAAKVHRLYQEMKLAARSDSLTGVANQGSFRESLRMEVGRMRRHIDPFTVVYMDLDNFKMANDQYGHQVGDEMLRSIAAEFKCQLRSTDIVARVGGDEFALILPSTATGQAQAVVTKLRDALIELMRRRRWPMTISMGVVTCMAPPESAEQITSMADDLLYAVKSSTKNDAFFVSWNGERFERCA